MCQVTPAPAVEADAAHADRVRRIALDVRSELAPDYVAVLRALPPGVRVGQAFALWRMARDALERQALRRGLSAEEAAAEGARRLLALHDDPAA